MLKGWSLREMKIQKKKQIKLAMKFSQGGGKKLHFETSGDLVPRPPGCGPAGYPTVGLLIPFRFSHADGSV